MLPLTCNRLKIFLCPLVQVMHEISSPKLLINHGKFFIMLLFPKIKELFKANYLLCENKRIQCKMSSVESDKSI